MIKEEQLKRLQKSRYKVFGTHNAVKLCLWCKKSIKTGGKEVCYKQKFYGINSHRCIQMTPALPFCNLRCIYCWRDVSFTKPNWEGKVDEPIDIVNGSIEAQRLLITGLGGVPHSEKHLKEAYNPNQVAISLEGEPTLYPRLSELIEQYHKAGFTTFLVTNGMFPEKILALDKLPTNLYVSLSANSEEMLKKVQSPITQTWKDLNKTLELLQDIKTRRVIRLTLVKELNMFNPEKYAELISKTGTDFVEVKAWMCVGSSAKRLKYEQMPSHNEIKEFSEKISDSLGYKFSNEQKESRVVLLKK